MPLHGRALPILGFSGFLLLLSTSPTHSYTCDLESLDEVRFKLEPGEKDVAPRNSRVRVFWNQRGDFEFVRIYVHKKDGSAIPGTSHRLAKEGEPGFEFIPAGAFDADAQYEVAIDVKSPDGDGQNGMQQKKIGTFATGRSLDKVPPSGSAVSDGALVLTDLRTDANNEHYPLLQLTVGNVADETASRAQLLFAVWSSPFGTPSDPIDYSRPPQAYYHAVQDDYGGHQVLMFNSPHVCSEIDFGYPRSIPSWNRKNNSWNFPKGNVRSAGWRIGVRAVDQAGHQGPEAEVMIDLNQPVYAARADDLRDLCEDAKVQEQVQILPRAGSTVPVNTHIWIWEGRRHQGIFGQIDGKVRPQNYRLLDSKKKLMPITSRTSFAGTIQVTEMIPNSPLAAKTAFQVVGQTGKPLTRFMTGETSDLTPPLGQIRSVNQGTGRAVKFQTATVSDGGSPEQDVIFGVWAPWQGDQLNLLESPRTYVLAKGGMLTLAEGGWCDFWSYSFPIERKQLKLSIVPIDLAGNRGLAMESSVDIRKMRSVPF